MKIMKITNKAQFERLESLMQINLDIARGITKSGSDVKLDIKNRWEFFTSELNILGPPMREINGWMKIWVDLKFKVKKKLTKNKTEISSTGGGPNRCVVLTPFEELVADMLNLHLAVDPPGQEFEKSVVSTKVAPVYTNSTCVDIDYENGHQEVDQFLSTPSTKHVLNKKTNVDKLDSSSNRLTLLDHQTKIQEKLYDTVNYSLSDVGNHLGEILKYTKRTYELKDKMKILRKSMAIKEEKLCLYKADLEHKRKHRNDKLKLKIELLELQERQLEIQDKEN